MRFEQGIDKSRADFEVGAAYLIDQREMDERWTLVPPTGFEPVISTLKG